MKKILLGVGVLMSSLLSAQNLVQTPLTNNNFLINPAAAGAHNDLNLFAGFRNAYTGIEGNPQTNLMGADFSINNKFGAGAMVGNESVGVFNNYKISLAGSYKLQISDSAFINFGLNGSVFFNNIDMQALNVEDMGDVAITQSLDNGMAWNFGFGGLFSWKDLNIGAAATRLLGSGFVFDNDNLVVNQIPDFNAFARYDIKFAKKYTISPIVGFDAWQNSPSLINANILVGRDGYYLGYGYNTNQANSVMAGIRLKEHVNLNYAYSFGGEGIMQGTNGTHEIGLAFTIKSMKDFGNNDRTEIDSLLNLVDSLTLKQNNLEKEKKALELQLKSIKAENKAEIEKLKSQIRQKDAEIAKLKAEMAKQAEQKSKAPKLSEGVEEVKNGDQMEKGKYYIVVSSVKKEAKAKAEVADFKKQGKNVFYVKNERGTWYYIVTSKFNDKKVALQETLKAKKEVRKDAWLYEHK